MQFCQKRSPAITINTLITTKPTINVYTVPASLVNSCEPGCSPWIYIALKNNAAGALPGIPRDKSGIKEPPVTALLAASDAIIPSTDPFPNSSGFLDAFSLHYKIRKLQISGPLPE